MNIAYISHTRFPTEKAHGYQVAQVCGALSALGHSVTLLAPDVHTGVKQSYETFYNTKHSFELQRLPTFDALQSSLVPGRFAFHFSMASYNRSLRRHFAETEYNLLYLRSPAILAPALATGIPTILELHTLPKRNTGSFVALCNRCSLVVCLTRAMRDAAERLGIDADRLLVEGDAVDLDRFATKRDSLEEKHHFDLPEDRIVVGYLGSLVTMDRLEKGVQFLVEALALCKKRNIPAYGWIVGGPRAYQEKYRRHAMHLGLDPQDFCFEEAIPPKHVPDALAAMDICVYPAPKSRHPYFQRDTSPLKLFEYLASGTPIVCADIPPVRDVVDSSTVRLVHPGSAKSLFGGILECIEDTKAAQERAKKGLKLVQKHTWKKRMERILGAGAL